MSVYAIVFGDIGAARDLIPGGKDARNIRRTEWPNRGNIGYSPTSADDHERG